MRRTIAALGSLLFLFVAPGVVAGLIPWTLSAWRLGPPLLGAEALRWLGAALIIAATACLLEAFARFALQGRGTPAPPFPTERLIVSGLYRHVRNPMYVAVLALIVGQALLFGDARLLAYAAIVWLAVHTFVVAYEEPTLRRRYGDQYHAYCARVRRWLPRIAPASDLEGEPSP